MGAMGLRFTDGTTTVTVSNGTTGNLLGYRQGSVGEEEPHSTDRARVLLFSSLSTIQATIASLNKLYRQARAYQTTKVGVRVFVERDLGDSVWWRSELIDAMPVTVESTYDLGLATGKMEFDMVFTRVNYWEGEEAQIPLTNGNGTLNTSGLTIYAVDDGQTGKDNYVAIGSAYVAGDLLAPVKLWIKNTYSGQGWEEIHIASNWRSTPGSFQHVFEGEDYSGGSESYSVLPGSPSYSAYSNGQYIVLNPTTTDRVFYYNLNNAFLQAAKSNYFRVMMRTVAVPSSDIWMKLAVRTSGGGIVWQNDWTRLDSDDSYFHDLGIVQLPPFKFLSSNTLETLNLAIYYKRPAGSIALNVDYIELFTLDSWRKLFVTTTSISYNDEVTDNQYDEILLNDWATTNNISEFIVYGGKTLLEPGVDQRIYIYPYVPVGSNHGLYTGSVKCWYRPRRLTL